jgi:hypothetical protein
LEFRGTFWYSGEHGFDGCWSPVYVQFQHVFTRYGVRRREVENQRVGIEDVGCGDWLTQRSEGRISRPRGWLGGTEGAVDLK